jgi:hypothetical protein
MNNSGFTSHVDGTGDRLAAGNTGTIYSSGKSNNTVLHESIHFLGLNDRYVSTNTSLTGPRATAAQRGFKNDIMATFGQTGFNNLYYQYFLNKASTVITSSDKFFYHPIFNLMKNQKVTSFPNDRRVDVNPNGSQKDFRYP